jgi:hypothetical protein
MVEKSFGRGYGEFLDITGGYDEAIKHYSKNLDIFYLMNLRRLFSSPQGKDYAKVLLNCKDHESTESIMKYVNDRFARKTVPYIKPRITSLRKSNA